MKISLIPQVGNETVHCSQGDTNRQWQIDIYGDKKIDIVDSPNPTYWIDKGGTEEILPTNTSVPSTSPIKCDIQYTDGLRTDQEFTYRESPATEDGSAKLKSIYGNTIVWNQLIQNGNFADSTNWKAQNNNSTLTVSSNYARVTLNSGTYSAYNPALGQSTKVQVITNHVYFTHFEVKPIKSCRLYVSSTILNTWRTNDLDPSLWNIFEGVYKASASGDAFSYIGSTNGSLESDDYIDYRLFNLIDITAMFGSTKADEILAMETAQAGSGVVYFKSLFPLPYYQYDAGSLLSFNGTGIKTVNADETEESTTSISTSTYFSTGMKSAGSVYDELSNNKAITRIGEVDLGTLTWVSGGTNTEGKYRFNTVVQGMKYPSGSSETPNVISDKYVTSTGVNTYRCETCIGASDSVIFIYDESLSTVTASDFKTAMDGVMLYYELETPTETNITSATMVTEYGESDLDSNGVVICNEGMSKYSGFHDAKIRVSDGDGDVYSAKFQVHVERKPK